MGRFPESDEPYVIVDGCKAWQLDLLFYAETYHRERNEFLTGVARGKIEEPPEHPPSIAEFNDISVYHWAFEKWEREDREFWETPRRNAEYRTIKYAKRGTDWSWTKTRDFVWVRDVGRCQVCGLDLEWNGWECGHIIDRVCGGSDRLSNLVVMCPPCNRLKPCHETREEFEHWVNSDNWKFAHIGYLIGLYKEGKL